MEHLRRLLSKLWPMGFVSPKLACLDGVFMSAVTFRRPAGTPWISLSMNESC
uniref:Uncharacterized protein n=1 Tax=Anguilla anguilla TaxID=7936 RepID=A0A0E9XTI0_ANGAN